MAGFSSSAEDVIKKKTDLSLTTQPQGGVMKDDRALWKYFEIYRCLEFLQTRSRVALQFPDHLLKDSVNIASILSKESGQDVYILGDTSYGSCCVDEVAAEHIQADGIIHFGPSCLSRTKRLPVLYVFGCEEVDTDDLTTHFLFLYSPEDPVLILYDVIYSHIKDFLQSKLSVGFKDVVVSQLLIPNWTTADSAVPVPSNTVTMGVASNGDSQTHECRQNESSETDKHSLGTCKNVFKFGRVLYTTRPFSEYKILYIGREGPTLTNFMFSFTQNEFHSYDPHSKTIRHESVAINKMLGRRYYLVQRAKEAMTVGILVGTLGVENYLPMIERLKLVLKSAGKQFYTVSVGKLNPAKLANLMEIDIFVLVSCPECSLVQSQEFYKPIVTPYEMEVACLRDKQWTGEVVLDYEELLNDDVTPPISQEEDETEFSFITGGLVRKGNGSGNDTPTDQTLVQRGDNQLIKPYSGARHLLGRSWQGLEKRIGETTVGGVVKGRSGIPSCYSNEKDRLRIN